MRAFDEPTYLDYPFRVDWSGRVATTDEASHVRNLVEQVLFTSPGERVNRPSFGSGLLQLLFKPNAALLAETMRVTASAALQQALGHLIDLRAFDVEADDNTLYVEIAYILRSTQEVESVRISRSA